jgi:hypothetical protein
MRLTGFDAIEFAEKAGLTLHKSANRIDDGAENLSVAEAEAIADDDPELIWLEVPESEYYGEPRNMERGDGQIPQPKLAGQRPDELLPGQNSGPQSRSFGAAGTPGGGAAAGGLAGTNAGDGSPDGEELLHLDNALADGVCDTSGDLAGADEPQSGRSGGAVGGTPAGKRTRGG